MTEDEIKIELKKLDSQWGFNLHVDSKFITLDGVWAEFDKINFIKDGKIIFRINEEYDYFDLILINIEYIKSIEVQIPKEKHSSYNLIITMDDLIHPAFA